MKNSFIEHTSYRHASHLQPKIFTPSTGIPSRFLQPRGNISAGTSRPGIRQLERSGLPALLHLVFDLFLVGTAFVTAYGIKRYLLPEELAGLTTAPNYYLILFVTVAIFAACFQFFNTQELLQRQKRFETMLVDYCKVVAAGTLLLICFIFVSHQQDMSRLLLGLFAVLAVLFLSLSRYMFFHLSRAQTQRDAFQKKVLLVGSKDRAREVADAIAADPNSECRLLGCLETTAELNDTEVAPGVKVIGLMQHFKKILLDKAVDEVVFAIPLKKIVNAGKYIAFAEKIGVNVRIIPDWQIQGIMYRPETARLYLDTFLGVPTISMSSTPAHEVQLFLKHMIDYLGAALGLIVLWPLFLIIGALIKQTSDGPVFFVQERSGLNGRKFKLFKFRTMVANAEQLRTDLAGKNEMEGPVFKMTDDPRITPLGKFLRKTSLDELPQLINVLRGEMSLVGPRPPIPDEVKQYRPWQRRRLSMKPGLTCIWQVEGRNNIDFKHWMKLDMSYIDNWSLLLDLKLLLRTIPAVFTGNGK